MAEESLPCRVLCLAMVSRGEKVKVHTYPALKNHSNRLLTLKNFCVPADNTGPAETQLLLIISCSVIRTDMVALARCFCDNTLAIEMGAEGRQVSFLAEIEPAAERKKYQRTI